jgi:hypothetical protein
MSRMSSTCGSELHLLRYLGRHRNDFDRRILAETGGDSIEWTDFRFDPRSENAFDIELKGLEFLRDSQEVQSAWTEFWPQGAGVQTWDAVGRIKKNGREEWLLIEAKAHLSEVFSQCKAKSGPGKNKIQSALAEVKRELGVSIEADWMSNYYQFCNRVAALYFLQKHTVPSRLLFVYFYGDRTGNGRDCPASAEGWHETLQNLDRHVGLPQEHDLKSRIHKLFVPVRRIE